MNAFFAEMEQFAMMALAGVANTSTPLPSVDPSHPAVTAAAAVALESGELLGKVFPSASALAMVGLPMIQGFAASLAIPAPAPAAAPAT